MGFVVSIIKLVVEVDELLKSKIFIVVRGCWCWGVFCSSEVVGWS